jgi:hypothetical protein
LDTVPETAKNSTEIFYVPKDLKNNKSLAVIKNLNFTKIIINKLTRHFLELWIILYKILHVGNALDGLVALGPVLEVLHERLDGLPDLTEVGVQVGRVELILGPGQDDVLDS